MTGRRFVVYGPAVGKQRPRFNQATGRVYTPQKTLRFEDRVRAAWRDAGAAHLGDGPLTMTVEVVCPRPAVHWRVNGELSAAGNRSPVPCKTPDLDNVLKGISDSCNGLAYRDDKQIVDVRITRRWGGPREPEHVVVELDEWREQAA